MRCSESSIQASACTYLWFCATGTHTGFPNGSRRKPRIPKCPSGNHSYMPVTTRHHTSHGGSREHHDNFVLARSFICVLFYLRETLTEIERQGFRVLRIHVERERIMIIFH